MHKSSNKRNELSHTSYVDSHKNYVWVKES